MRHRKGGFGFGRTTEHRKALLKNMSIALISKEKIQTTLPKAKQLRRNVERLITLGKQGTLHARRLAISAVPHKETIQKLFETLNTRYAARNGGYTRIIRLGKRMGDAASMAVIELVDRVEITPVKEKTQDVTPKAAESTEKQTKAKTTKAKISATALKTTSKPKAAKTKKEEKSPKE